MNDKLVYRASGGVAALGVLIICSAAFVGSVPRAKVTGRVTYRGHPVIWGSVVVAAKDGRVAEGPINPDGTYTVESAPAGVVAIGVVSRDPLVQTWQTNIRQSRDRVTAKSFGKSPVDRKKWFPLPPQLEQPENSGLSLTLQKGDNEFNIELQ